MSDNTSNDKKAVSKEQRMADLAPEMHNDEQDDHRMQAQEVSEEARRTTVTTQMPTESGKGPNKTDLMNDSTQDTIDKMRDMESSGRIDMHAFDGEPNHDDNVDKFGKAAKPDGLRGDGT